MKQLARLYQQALHRMNSGDFNSALRLTRKIQRLNSSNITSSMVGGLLIDIGCALGKREIVEEGVELLEEDLEIVQKEECAPSAYYNLANGYCGLFDFELKRDSCAAYFKETAINKAKSLYRKALQYESRDPSLTANTLVNLGNCFDNLGRAYDALECYEKALKLKPNHGMVQHGLKLQT